MAFCYVCNKSKQYGHIVSHSKRRTKRVFKPNVFRKKMHVEKIQNEKAMPAGRQGKMENGEAEILRIKICSKCLKRAKKFGEVKAAQEAELAGRVVRQVDWAGRTQETQGQRMDANLTDTSREAEVAEEESKGTKKEEKGASVEELVGKKG